MVAEADQRRNDPFGRAVDGVVLLRDVAHHGGQPRMADHARVFAVQHVDPCSRAVFTAGSRMVGPVVHYLLMQYVIFIERPIGLDQRLHTEAVRQKLSYPCLQNACLVAVAVVEFRPFAFRVIHAERVDATEHDRICQSGERFNAMPRKCLVLILFQCLNVAMVHPFAQFGSVLLVQHEIALQGRRQPVMPSERIHVVAATIGVRRVITHDFIFGAAAPRPFHAACERVVRLLEPTVVRLVAGRHDVGLNIRQINGIRQCRTAEHGLHRAETRRGLEIDENTLRRRIVVHQIPRNQNAFFVREGHQRRHDAVFEFRNVPFIPLPTVMRSLYDPYFFCIAINLVDFTAGGRIAQRHLRHQIKPDDNLFR